MCNGPLIEASGNLASPTDSKDGPRVSAEHTSGA